MPPASDDDLGPLGQSLGFWLRVAQNGVFEQSKKAFAELDLRPQEYGLLLLVDHKPGRMQKDVATALRVREANLVAMLNRLQKRKLVRRSAPRKDGRTRVVDLTRTGEKLLRRAVRIEANLGKEFDRKLSRADRARLVKFLTKLGAPD